MITSADTEKALENFSTVSLFKKKKKKTLNKLGIKGKLLNMIKGIHEKPTANNILTNKNLKDFPLKSGKKRMFTLSISIQYCTGGSN